MLLELKYLCKHLMLNNKEHSTKTNDRVNVNSSISKDVHFDNSDFKSADLILKDQDSKKIAEEIKIPLSTLRRRTKKIIEKGLVNNRREINYEIIGLNKAFVL